jgi:hypothetical protein
LKMGKAMNLISTLLTLLTSKVFDIMERSVSGLSRRELLCSCLLLNCIITVGLSTVTHRQSIWAKEVDPYAGSSIFDIRFSGFAFAMVIGPRGAF